MGGVEVIGIGAVAAGFGTLVWKMWDSHTKITSTVTTALVDNTKSNLELREAIRAQSAILVTNTEAVKTAVQESKETRDQFSRTLLEVLKK